MRPDEKLSSYESVCLFTVLFLHHVFNDVLPTLVTDAGSAAWIAQLIGSGLGIGLLVLFLLLLRRYPGMDLLQITERVYGRVFGKVMQAILFFYLLAFCVECLNQAVETLQIYAYADMTSLRLDLLLVVTVCLFAVYSIKGLAKTVGLFLPVILFSLLIILLLCRQFYDPDLLHPLLGYGMGSILEAGGKLGSQFAGIAILAVFAGAFPDLKTYRKASGRAVALASLFIVGTTLCYNMAVPYTTAQGTIGIMGLAQANHNSRFLQRIESIFIIITVMEFLLLVGIAFLALQKTYCRLFAIQPSHEAGVLFPLGLVMICLLRTMGNLQGFKVDVRVFVRRISLVFLAGYCLLTLLVGTLRKQGRRRVARGAAAMLVACMVGGLLTGCNSQREPDSEIYPVILGYDRGENEKYRMTMKFMELDKAVGGSGSEGKGEGSEEGDELPPGLMVFEAPSFLEGINMINALMPKRVSLLHVKMMVVSEDLARDGIKSFVLPLSQYSDVKTSMAFVISKSSAYDFIAAEKATLTDAVQVDMELILETNKESTPYLVTSVAQVLNHCNSTYGDAVVSYGNVNQAEYKDRQEEQDSPDEKIARTTASYESGFLAGDLPVMGHSGMELAGLAVTRDSKMVGTLTTEECQTMAFLTDAFKTTLLTIPDPYQPEEAFISLRIRRAQPVHHVTWMEDDVVHIHIHVGINGTVSLSQNIDVAYNSNTEQRQTLKEYASDIMEQRSRALIRKLQEEYDADVLQLGRRAARNFATIPGWEDYNWRERYKDAEITVSYQINL